MKQTDLSLLPLRQAAGPAGLHEDPAQLRQLDRAHGQMAQAAGQGQTHQGGCVNQAVLMVLLVLLLVLLRALDWTPVKLKDDGVGGAVNLCAQILDP